jgi:hypothetical protein
MKYLVKNLSNLFGWNTKKKIIVLESDDWGSIRMPSKEVYGQLNNLGFDLNRGDSGRYNNFDTMESESDLNCLFEVLSKYKDIEGNNPIFTALTLVTNPDFDKIKANNFIDYYYETTATTFENYGHNKVENAWEIGISNKLITPELHGREHLNVASWMRALKKNDYRTIEAFERRMWGFRNINKNGVNYQAAFDLEIPEDIIIQKKILKDAISLFYTRFKRKPRYFVPPNGPYNDQLDSILSKNGIDYLSTPKIHKMPLGNMKFKKQIHFLGNTNKNGLTYLTRNAFFEPSDRSKDWVASCLHDISIAFKFKKPSIISTHRVNFIGTLNESNRTYSLQCLSRLLNEIQKNWPDCIFLSSTQLGDMIKNDRNNKKRFI